MKSVYKKCKLLVSLIMDVDCISYGRKENCLRSGQSVLEFVLFVPVIIAFVGLFYKVNSAILMSINNQKFARAHTLFLTYNSPVYPRRATAEKDDFAFAKFGWNRITQGVSNEIGNAQGKVEVVPQIQQIVRSDADLGNDDEFLGESGERGRVRVRTTVTLCTPTLTVSQNGKFVPVTEVRQGTDWNLTLKASLCKGKGGA